LKFEETFSFHNWNIDYKLLCLAINTTIFFASIQRIS